MIAGPPKTKSAACPPNRSGSAGADRGPCNTETRQRAKDNFGRFVGVKWIFFAWLGILVGLIAVLLKQSLEFGIYKRFEIVERI
eukprot:gene9086-50200_t